MKAMTKSKMLFPLMVGASKIVIEAIGELRFVPAGTSKSLLKKAFFSNLAKYVMYRY